MAEIVLPEGFLPLVTEGSLASGGESDVRRPHLPENVAVFRAYQASDGKAQRYNKSTDHPTSSIFVKSDNGTFVIKEQITGEARYAVTAARAGAGEQVGTFPKYSGLTIGMGCDMGASYSKAEQVESLFNYAAELSGDIALIAVGKQLGEAAGKRGMLALAVTNKLRKAIQLTPQQVLNLQNAMWKRKEKGIAGFIKNGIIIKKVKILEGGIFDYSKLYEPLKQILIRAAYGSLYRVADIAKNLSGIDALNPLGQCNKMLEAFKIYNYDKWVKYGFVAIVEKFKSELSKGNTIKIKEGPIQLTDLLDANNPVGDWMTEIRKSAKNDKNDFREKLRSDLKKQGIDPVKPNNSPNPTPNPSNNENNNNNADSTNIVELIQMAMSGKGSIKGKVGKGGDNNTQDVIVIKALLNSHGYYDFTYNPITILTEMFSIGTSDAKLEAAITKFQTDKGAKKPDGRVDPNGTTLGWLNAPKSNTVETPSVVENPPAVETPAVVENPPAVETPPNNNTNNTTPQKGEKDVILFAGCVQMITEGNLASGGSNDTKRPHYPQNVSYFQQVAAGSGTHKSITPSIGVFQIQAGGGWQEQQQLDRHNCDGNALTQGNLVMGTYLVSGKIGSSGLTIGQGFDLGAKYPNKDTKAAKKRLTDAGIADDIATQLAATAGIQGVRAAQEASRLRKSGIEISQDNVVNLLRLTIDDYGSKFNLSNIHEALVDTYKAICYAIGDGGASKRGLGDLTNKVRGKSNIEQCDNTIAWLKEQGFPKHVKHVERLRKTFADGGNVTLSKEIFSVEKLMSPDNDMADWVGAVKGIDFKKQVFAINVQQRLIKEKFLAPTFKNSAGQTVSSADGNFGSGSQAALKQWQTANQLPPTGLIDEATKAKMFGDILKPNNGNNPTPVNPTEPSKVTMPALMGDATYGCYH